MGGPRGGVIGVVSKSEDESIRLYDESIRLYNDRDHYNEWLFVYITTTTQVTGAPGVQQGDAGRGQQGRLQPGQFGSGQRGRLQRVGAEGRWPRRSWVPRWPRAAPTPAWGRRKTSRRSPDTESG